MDDDDLTTPQAPGLLTIAAELRNRILIDLTTVTNDEGEPVIMDIKKFCTEKSLLGFNVAFANKQLRHEYLTLLYGNNTFEFVQFHANCPTWTPQSQIDKEQGSPIARYAPFHFGVLPQANRTFAMALPSTAARGMMKHFRLVLTAPYPYYDDAKIDWLYPACKLNELGFYNLERLTVVVRFGNRCYVSVSVSEAQGIFGKGQQLFGEEGMRYWVGQKMAMGKAIDAEHITWVFEKHSEIADDQELSFWSL
ncbi:hypothetical protein LTR08_001522 [Meristemomyces frigidus]|nr:hypothetical protein LTR08_001522 [Meristemomyces frigidus]